MKGFKIQPHPLLLTPQGLYLWQGSWIPMNHLKDCPKDVDLFIDGFAMTCQSHKLPPLNLLQAYRISRQRIHLESISKNTQAWGMIHFADHHKVLNTTLPFDRFEWPDFNAFDIWVHRCHWLPFAYLSLSHTFQEQQPCGGVIILSQSLNKDYQVCFIQGQMLKMIRPLLKNQSLDQALQETLHYCVNEYGIDPADIKTLNLTDHAMDGDYHLTPQTLSPHHLSGVENTLFECFQSLPFYAKWFYMSHDPQNHAQTQSLKPLGFGLKGLSLALGMVLSLNVWENFMAYQDLKQTQQQKALQLKIQNDLLPTLNLSNPIPWDLLESIAKKPSQTHTLARLQELAPLAEQNILLQEFLWTRENANVDGERPAQKETLKLRFVTQGLSDETEEVSQTHQVVFDYLENLWGSDVRIEQHDNRLEVLF